MEHRQRRISLERRGPSHPRHTFALHHPRITAPQFDLSSYRFSVALPLGINAACPRWAKGRVYPKNKDSLYPVCVYCYCGSKNRAGQTPPPREARNTPLTRRELPFLPGARPKKAIPHSPPNLSSSTCCGVRPARFFKSQAFAPRFSVSVCALQGWANGPARRPGGSTSRKNTATSHSATFVLGAPPRAADASLSPRTAIPCGIALLALSFSGSPPAVSATSSDELQPAAGDGGELRGSKSRKCSA